MQWDLHKDCKVGSKLRDGRMLFLVIKALEMKERGNSQSSLGIIDGTDLIFYFQGLEQKARRCC